MPDSDLTQVGIFMGTPGYSPPEAIREGRYTPQADVFAWGAVFYELLSGRIPYEGPDTKTTNGYVVQGNAPPPTRHDGSIPEPLSTVVMTALQPSDKNRFKDASEAEQALRDAWDRCLTQGIVHASVLAMEEIVHEKAPARMHEPRTRPSQQPPASFATDSSEVTAIDDKMLAKPFVIESQKGPRGDEDDPTRLVVRDDGRGAKGKPDKTERGVATPGQAVARTPASGNPQVANGTVQKTERLGTKRSSKAVWVILLVLVFGAGAVVALHFAGVIS
jgi:serine/threonine-protein kinase